MTDAENKPSEGKQPPEDTPTSDDASSSEAGPTLPAPRKTLLGMGALRGPSTPDGALSLSERLRKISVPTPRDAGPSSNSDSQLDEVEVEPTLDHDDPDEDEESAPAPVEDDGPATIEMHPDDLDDLDASDAPSESEDPALGPKARALPRSEERRV